jgi:hypothetical protein
MVAVVVALRSGEHLGPGPAIGWGTPADDE